jgi:FkbM family methyltransferase
MRELRGRNLMSCSAFVHHIICFGPARGPFFYAQSKTRLRSAAREVSVPVPGSPLRVAVRAGTTDASVFDNIYHGQAYDWELRQDPKVIVDAGAYTGLSTVFFALRYPEARIVAIEPDEQNFSLLNKNTAGLDNVKTVRAALWGVSGSVSLVDPGDGSWGFRIDEADSSQGDNRSSMLGSVRAVTVVDIMREYALERIDLLKLDVEGSEKEIFAVSDEWIGSVDAICLELHDRFKAGCSRNFFSAVREFPIEVWRGEDVLVARDRSQLPEPAVIA